MVADEKLLTRLIETVADAVVDRRLRDVPEPLFGDVTSAVPLEVHLDGDPAGTATPIELVDAAYVPTVTDRVWLLRIGTGLMVGGKVVDA